MSAFHNLEMTKKCVNVIGVHVWPCISQAESLVYVPIKVTNIAEIFNYFSGAQRCFDIDSKTHDQITATTNNALLIEGHRYVVLVPTQKTVQVIGVHVWPSLAQTKTLEYVPIKVTSIADLLVYFSGAQYCFDVDSKTHDQLTMTASQDALIEGHRYIVLVPTADESEFVARFALEKEKSKLVAWLNRRRDSKTPT